MLKSSVASTCNALHVVRVFDSSVMVPGATPAVEPFNILYSSAWDWKEELRKRMTITSII